MQTESKFEYAGQLLKALLTPIPQVKLNVDGVMTEERLKAAISEKNQQSAPAIAFVRGGEIQAQEDTKLMTFINNFGGEGYKRMMCKYSKVFTSNIAEDAYKTLNKLNDFAEYLSEDDVCKLQRENGVKYFTDEGTFEVRMNRNNIFQPIIVITKNGVNYEWVAKNSICMESILAFWFTEDIQNSIANYEYGIDI